MVLIIVMMVATLLLIALTAVLPSVYQEGQREREEELIFRGTQYAKAVGLFHKQFGRYPVSIKELLQTNGKRFLRQEYRDPMDPKGKWRFIHVSASGVLLDSLNQPLNPNNSNPAGIGQSNPSNPTQGGSSFMGSSSPGFGNSGGFGGGSGGFQGAGLNPSSGSSSATGFSSSSSSFGSSTDVQGAFIAGVAATTHHQSIKVWQKHTHYDEWEFLGIDMGVFGTQVGMPGMGGPGMGQPSNPQGSSFSPGPTGSTPSPTGFGSSNSSTSFGPSQN
jgi:type II secretory pathway pseudopilin PulG